jgi:hypothetical protein
LLYCTRDYSIKAAVPVLGKVRSRCSRAAVLKNNITIKTPNPKCRLYWCLIEFIDWRFSQSCWYLRPALYIEQQCLKTLYKENLILTSLNRLRLELQFQHHKMSQTEDAAHSVP